MLTLGDNGRGSICILPKLFKYQFLPNVIGKAYNGASQMMIQFSLLGRILLMKRDENIS